MSNDRKKYTPNENLVLHCEVEGICPLCASKLMYEKKKQNHKKYEIAHIYPLNPTPIEKKLLSNEKRLSNDPNSLDNVICLCVDCHTKFDKPRTVEEYRNLVKIKERITQRNQEKELWNNSELEENISSILSELSNDSDFDFLDDDILSYNPKTIDDKTDSTISLLTKRKIKSNVQDYYKFIKTKFKELDTLEPTSTELISTQIKSYYLKTKRISPNNEQIFESIVNWLDKKTGNISRTAAEIIVSYFIQNCEIFE